MTRRTPAQYDWGRLLFDEQWMTKHYQALSGREIRFVVAHHMTIRGTGNGAALDACYAAWQTRQASAHYGVDGTLVRQYVRDKDYAWATGSTEGNLHGISVEHANSAVGDASGWPVAENTLDTGARLTAQLHVAYRLGRPTSNATGTSGTMRQHSSFFATACPGPFFKSAWLRYVAMAQAHYDKITGSDPVSEEDEMKRIGIWTNDGGSYNYAILDPSSGFVKVIANGGAPVDAPRLAAWALAWNIPAWVNHGPATYNDWIAETRKIAQGS